MPNGQAAGQVPAIPDSARRLEFVLQSGPLETPQVGLRVPLRRIVALIGSRPGCRIRLSHHDVSSVHAAVVFDGSGVNVLDLRSSTGTLLNDDDLDHAPLRNRDLLRIGPMVLRFVLGPARSTVEDLHPFALEPAPSFVALEHMDTGRILQPKRDICIIGRRPGSDIHIEDERVSRAHALFFHYCGFPVIVDLRSRNHTFVNDERTAYRRLRDGDVISIGDARFRARLVESGIVKRAATTPPSTIVRPPKTTQAVPDDEVDIRATEDEHHWHIVDGAEQVAARRR